MTRHIFLCGAKGVNGYGGYETFVSRLAQAHARDPQIRYYIACKANGSGAMDAAAFAGMQELPQEDGAQLYQWQGAVCFRLQVPEIGPAQAIAYDIAAVEYSIRWCLRHGIRRPVIYLLGCRIGPWARLLRKKLRAVDGILLINPDGHEWQRAKWSLPVRRYWKLSERLMVRAADRVICDSMEMERYIRQQYGTEKTEYIAYGADTDPNADAAEPPAFAGWLAERGLKPREYYLVVCRFVPENSFREILAGFMASHTRRKLALITTEDPVYLARLEQELHMSGDPRICFAGTLYERELLRKVREEAWAYLHGHTVGGTNPSLLESMAATELSLVRDVPFNREAGQDAVLYWKTAEDLTHLIDAVDGMAAEERAGYSRKARQRIREAYSWQLIADRYARLWENMVPEETEKTHT